MCTLYISYFSQVNQTVAGLLCAGAKRSKRKALAAHVSAYRILLASKLKGFNVDLLFCRYYNCFLPPHRQATNNAPL